MDSEMQRETFDFHMASFQDFQNDENGKIARNLDAIEQKLSAGTRGRIDEITAEVHVLEKKNSALAARLVCHFSAMLAFFVRRALNFAIFYQTEVS